MEQKISPLLCWCDYQSIKLGDLSSSASVGIALFLALAVLQLVGAGGVGQLRRKSGNLKESITVANLSPNDFKITQIDAELLRMELSLEKLSKTLFFISFSCVFLSLIGMSVISLAPRTAVSCGWIAFILIFYMGLPMAIFTFSYLTIQRKCRNVSTMMTECQNEVLASIGLKFQKT